MAAKRKASAMLHHNKEPMTPDHPTENNDDIDQYPGLVKDAEKLKLMLLAWNYHSQAQARAAGGDSETPVIPPLANDDVAGLWASYHSALGLTKGRSPPRENSSPVLLAGGETGSAHDETSSSGHKDDEEGSEDESDDRIDTLAHDPERLKAFNMFVRLFVDENLDRMVPISKQPKEKIQAIIDSCTRQFPEFAERARKRIRTYLKSCRRNKKVRDGTGTWDSSARPTPAHLTSVQAEQILAQACENESHNAKRMRVGLEPVSQPMPASTSSPAETTIAPSLSHYPIKSEEGSISSLGAAFTTVTSTPTAPTTPKPQTSTTNSRIVADPPGPVSCLLLNGGLNNATCTSTTPTSLYRPNFTQAFQRTTSTGSLGTTATTGYTGALFPGQTFNAGIVGNGPTDLSMKSRPLLSHKLSGLEMGAVRALVTGYRESAAFLLRSADELEALLLQQQ